MPFPTFEPRRHDARPTNISAYSLAAVLMVIAALIAGDKPAPIAADAPPETFSQEQREHWAYQPVKRVDPPAVKESGWVKNPIDRFILAEIEKLGMTHAPEADRVALIRRVTFDLTGLPPSPDEVAAFLGDRPPGRLRTAGRSLARQSRVTASAGASTGSTWLITPIPTASSSTPSGPTPGAIATGSSAP